MTLDWAEVRINGQGNELNHQDIDQVLIGRSHLDLQALEDQFLDLELIADELWEVDLEAGTSADLSLAQGNSGTFPGFDDSSTWIIALRCTTCANPAPPYLTVVRGCTG